MCGGGTYGEMKKPCVCEVLSGCVSLTWVDSAMSRTLMSQTHKDGKAFPAWVGLKERAELSLDASVGVKSMLKKCSL